MFNVSPELSDVWEKAQRGERLSRDDGIRLMESSDLLSLGHMANHVREKIHGKKVYWRNDLNINQTNVCYIDCELCAFWRHPGQEGAYTFSVDDVRKKVTEARETVEEYHIVGGYNPSLRIGYYEEMFRAIKEIHPEGFIQALTAMELFHLAKLEKMSIKELMSRLANAGLGSVPGGGAEIFDPEVRKIIASKKISGKVWLDTSREVHLAGVRSNATMLYGHIEKAKHRIDHMLAIRELQDETHGFQAFIPLEFNPENTALEKQLNLKPVGAFEDLRVAAVSRLMMDNIPHTKMVWQTIGKPTAQLALDFGLDDIGGSSFEERILNSTYGKTFHAVTESDLPNIIHKAGKEPVRINSGYVQPEKAIATD